ncbi:MAG: hypothetical protein CM1200mP10_26930 [Candidatus Neomarinimicrobiota bacterium]|nr:MAG: hypothetical protein CM1200mP10_26930 [Candidatus Neomarinimicrobiota bacterium]
MGLKLAMELMITIFPDEFSFIVGTKGIIELVTPRILVEKTWLIWVASQNLFCQNRHPAFSMIISIPLARL